MRSLHATPPQARDGVARTALALVLAGLAGIVSALFVVVALAAAPRAPWTRIVVRVAGSWVAAAGLLLLGWALRAA
jgi:hypothetical protein